MYRFVILSPRSCMYKQTHALPIIHLDFTDIDECAEGTHGCAQTCTNVVGGYSCSCDAGYRLASNRHTCNDISECVLSVDGCAHICTNTIGSYICLCNSGYRLASDGRACTGELY